MTDAVTRRTYLLGFLAWLPWSLHAQDGDIRWQHRAQPDKVSLMANPLGTAARLSFFEGRGFSAAVIRPYAQACGFSFGMLNEGTETVTAELGSWRAVDADGREIAFRLPEEWADGWRQAAVSEPARIAFRWAQFQVANRLAPGDWIMGMATLKAVARSPLRVVARYRDNRGEHEIQLDNLRCADD